MRISDWSSDVCSSDLSGTTRATRDGDCWTLEGSKYWISNGSIADVILVFAQTDPGSRHRGMAAFLVPGDPPGLERRPIGGKRSEERRVGKARVSTCRYLWSPDPYTNKQKTITD